MTQTNLSRWVTPFVSNYKPFSTKRDVSRVKFFDFKLLQQQKEFIKPFMQKYVPLNSLLFASRRFGKDTVFSIILHYRAINYPGNYYYVFPTASDVHNIMFSGIVTADGKTMFEAHMPQEFVVGKPKNVFGTIEVTLINGSVIKYVGADATGGKRVAGANATGIAITEFQYFRNAEKLLGTIKPTTYGVLQKNTTKTFLMINMTAADDYGHAHDHYNQVQAKLDKCHFMQVNAKDFMSDNMLALMHEEFTPYQIAREFNLDWSVASDDSLLGDSLRYIKFVESSSSGRNVFTVWDLGFRDPSVCIIFTLDYQKKEIVILDWIKQRGKSIDSLIGELKLKPYNYLGHFLPHDGVNKTIASAGYSARDWFYNWTQKDGGFVRVIDRTCGADGGDSARYILEKGYVKCATSCTNMVDELRRYRPGQSDDHLMDCFRYFGVVVRAIFQNRCVFDRAVTDEIGITMRENWFQRNSRNVEHFSGRYG